MKNNNNNNNHNNNNNNNNNKRPSLLNDPKSYAKFVFVCALYATFLNNDIKISLETQLFFLRYFPDPDALPKDPRTIKKTLLNFGENKLSQNIFEYNNENSRHAFYTLQGNVKDQYSNFIDFLHSLHRHSASIRAEFLNLRLNGTWKIYEKNIKRAVKQHFARLQLNFVDNYKAFDMDTKLILENEEELLLKNPANTSLQVEYISSEDEQMLIETESESDVKMTHEESGEFELNIDTGSNVAVESQKHGVSEQKSTEYPLIGMKSSTKTIESLILASTFEKKIIDLANDACRIHGYEKYSKFLSKPDESLSCVESTKRNRFLLSLSIDFIKDIAGKENIKFFINNWNPTIRDLVAHSCKETCLSVENAIKILQVYQEKLNILGFFKPESNATSLEEPTHLPLLQNKK